VGRASVDESSKDDLGFRMLDHHFSHRTKVMEQIGARRYSRKEGGEFRRGFCQSLLVFLSRLLDCFNKTHGSSQINVG